MIFVNNITELEYYYPNPEFGCYTDAIFEPRDILLQANGFTATSIGITIAVCDAGGNFVEDGTIYFTWNFRSIVIAGITYYYLNIRGDNFSPYMISDKCFTLRVTLTDPSTGAIVFDKWTQRYTIVTATAAVVPPPPLMDGSPMPLCVAAVNPAICATSSGSYIKLEVTFDCYDTYTGDIYAEGTVISSYGELFLYTHLTYIDGRFRDVPTEISVTLSINCRVQKTAITEQYVLNGDLPFPVWKMKEIQRMMLSNKKYIGGVEYHVEGQTIFEQLPRPYNCLYSYKLTIAFQDCFKWQIFGCVPDCRELAAFYMFPEPFERVYDDGMGLIATTPEELIIYFSGLPGYKSAVDLPYAIPCPVDALIRVESSGVLPKFLYYDAPIPGQRIFPKMLPVNTLDFTPLCNGVTYNNQVQPVDITGYESEDIVVPVPDITGYDSVNAELYTMQISAPTGWIIDNSVTSGVNEAGIGTLNLSLTTDTYIPPFVNMLVAAINGEGAPGRQILITPTDNGNMPPASSLLIDTDGRIYYSGPETSDLGGGSYKVELFMIKYPL